MAKLKCSGDLNDSLDLICGMVGSMSSGKKVPAGERRSSQLIEVADELIAASEYASELEICIFPKGSSALRPISVLTNLALFESMST